MRKIISVFIFLTMSLAISATGAYVLDIGAKNGSNVTRISQVINNSESKRQLAFDGNSDSSQVLAESTENKCGVDFDQLISENSVVDFLFAENKDFSYEYRLQLAQKYGIENYTGKSEQNLKLLSSLKREAGCI